uniref:Putative terminase n=1 Tax=viral metagenome TaxID=1070528 RepID=A0A6M3L6M7_9ZZZZ
MPKVFRANPVQAKFLASQARFVGFMGGIGSGKTAGGCVKSIMKLEDGDGIVVAPDFPHFCKSTFPELAKWLPWSRVTNRHLNHPNTGAKVLTIETSRGERKIYYGGMQDASSWAGPSVNWAFADEFRRVPTRQHFDVLAGRIRVGDNPQLWLTTTPKAVLRGRRHWLHEVFVEQKFDEDFLKAFASSGQTLVEYFMAPTSENAPNLDPMYLASLQALYKGKYARQELGGEFIEFEGQVFEDFNEADNVSEMAEFVPGVPVEWGVDNGFTAGHPRVILMAQTIPPFINVFAEYVATFELSEVSIDNAIKMGYPLPTVARVDSSAAELIQRLWERGIETYKGSHDVDAGIAHLRSFIRDGKDQVHVRFHPRCTFSIDEIQAYVYPDTVESKISEASDRAARPLKESDNAADALRYLVWPKQLALLAASTLTARQVIRVDSPRPGPPSPVPQVQVAQGSSPNALSGAGVASGSSREHLLRPPVGPGARVRSLLSIFGGPRKPRPARPTRTREQMPPGW